MAKIKRENLQEHLIEKQLNMLDLTILDALFNPDWKEKWFLTQEQHLEWKEYCLKTMKKTLKINNTKALETFDFLNKWFGLKVK